MALGTVPYHPNCCGNVWHNSRVYGILVYFIISYRGIFWWGKHYRYNAYTLESVPHHFPANRCVEDFCKTLFRRCLFTALAFYGHLLYRTYNFLFNVRMPSHATRMCSSKRVRNTGVCGHDINAQAHIILTPSNMKTEAMQPFNPWSVDGSFS